MVVAICLLRGGGRSKPEDTVEYHMEKMNLRTQIIYAKLGVQRSAAEKRATYLDSQHRSPEAAPIRAAALEFKACECLYGETLMDPKHGPSIAVRAAAVAKAHSMLKGYLPLVLKVNLTILTMKARPS